MVHVLCVGEALIDFLGEGTGGLETAEAFRPAPGGAAANVAAAAARAGVPTGFAGRVGDDAFGRRLRAALEAAGVDCDGMLVDPRLPTTMAFVMPASHGPHGFAFVRGADAALSPEDLAAGSFAGLRALGCGGVSLSAEPARAAVLHALAESRRRSVLSLFDVNWRPALWPSAERAVAATRAAAALADIVKCNDAELELLAGPGEPQAQAERLLAGLGPDGPRAVVATLGDRGAVWVGRTIASHPGYRVDAVDAIGAGDCFGATLLAWWARRSDGSPARAALDRLTAAEAAALLARCNAAAALSTLTPGAIGAMPSGAAVDALLADRGT